MNNEKLILQCLSILLSDPDGNNGQVRMTLMKKINEALTPPTNDLSKQRAKEIGEKELTQEEVDKKIKEAKELF